MRNEAYDNANIYKDKTKKWHDQRILRKEFKLGEIVLLYNSMLKLFLGKLRSRWSGSYTVISATPIRVVALRTNSGNEFQGNGQKLKQYLRGILNEK